MKKLALCFFALFATQPILAMTSMAPLYQEAQASGLNRHVLSEALNAYGWAKSHNDINKPSILTVIDYSKPSTQKRLWVLDLKHQHVLMHTLVAHGSGTGNNYAKYFSNRFQSHQTSLGVFVTDSKPYYGKHGRSLRVHGLESGINNNAFRRDIEIHGAGYVSSSFAQSVGRLGRTWGCFGVSLAKAQKLINTTVGGSVIFAYASPENNDPVATNSWV